MRIANYVASRARKLFGIAYRLRDDEARARLADPAEMQYELLVLHRVDGPVVQRAQRRVVQSIELDRSRSLRGEDVAIDALFDDPKIAAALR